MASDFGRSRPPNAAAREISAQAVRELPRMDGKAGSTSTVAVRRPSRKDPPMDWKLALTTFVTVFLAEMGDKTQLATLSFASSGSRVAVFVGSAVALIATTAIAVLAGGIVARHVPPVWIRRAAGALFLLLGVVFLVTAKR